MISPFIKNALLATLTGTLLWSGAVLAAPSQADSSSTVNITFLHLNDVYEYNTVDDGRKGSFPRIETLRAKIKAKNPNTLFVFSGDTISPSVASSLFRGRQMIEMWNALGLDFATLGNHEFDFGPDVLKQRMKESRFEWLISNVHDANSPKFSNASTGTIRECGGVKIGLFGLLTPDTAENSNAGAQVVFEDPVASAKKTVAELRGQGAEIVVAITHETLEEDKKLARECDIDLILGGHEHYVLQSLVGKTPILKWGSDARILGKVDIAYSKTEHKIAEFDWSGISVGKSVPSDPRISEQVKKFDGQLGKLMDQKLTISEVELEGRSSRCRTRETNLGNLVADAMRDSCKADVGLVGGSSIRIDRVIPKGPLTRRSALMILPYENPVVKLKVSGSLLLQILEHSLSKLNSKSTPFPQVSGMRLQYSSKAAVGSRVKFLSINGKPVQPGASYTLAVSNFLYKGGSGFSMLKQCPCIGDADDSPTETAILMEGLAKFKTVHPKVEGRIEKLD